jgi:hypothetical protein
MGSHRKGPGTTPKVWKSPWLIAVGAFVFIVGLLGIGGSLISDLLWNPVGSTVSMSLASQEDEDKDCAHFDSQIAAQSFFDVNDPARDPHRLDADNDNIPCEALSTTVTEGEYSYEQAYESGAVDRLSSAPVPPSTEEPKIVKTGTPDSSEVNVK